MKKEICPYEDSLMQAMRTGQWNKDLRAHVPQCENCAEAVQVSRWMGSLAEIWSSAEPVPDPSLLWLKAQLAEQQQLEKRALHWAILGQAVAQFALLVALSVLILRIWPSIDMLISRYLLWMPNVLDPSIPSIEGPIAYLTSPALILFCFGFGSLLLPRWRRTLGF